MSLRARLLAVLAALTLVGLLAADIATYAALRSFLYQRLDRTVATSAEVLGRSAVTRGGFDPTDFAQLVSANPGVYIGVVFPTGAVQSYGTPPGAPQPPQPKLPNQLPVGANGEGATFTASAVGSHTRYRVRALPLDTAGHVLIVAVPLGETYATLHRLLLIEVLVSVVVLAAVVGAGLWLIRLSLRPLRRIEETAGAIAGGDLSQRVEEAPEGTEVGRLGRALNAMLSQIERAFAERAASEERLRRFVADASHELRTPLASVRAYAELFERGAKERPEDLARAMAGIERESARMGALVDDLLLLARLDQRKPIEHAPVDLIDVARDAVDAARALEPARQIELAAAADSVVVSGEREQLRRMLDNLLANARAHTPISATVRVEVESVTGDGAVVQVCDAGPGMSEDEAARVFERFYRADPARSRDQGGTGLGLAIVAAIAEAHHGDAEVITSPGHGTTFRVRLAANGVGEQTV